MDPRLALDFTPVNLVEKADEVFLLGRVFTKEEGYDKAKEFVRSRLWMTYRRDFSKIDGDGPSSDQGWGCMLRCGQMILAQALVHLKLGKDWVWEKEAIQSQVYIDILKMFQDDTQVAFSIHKIAQMGVSEGKTVGSWLGPNTVTQYVLKKLVFFDEKKSIGVHVAMDNLLIHDDVEKVAMQDRSEEEGWKSVLIFVPLRLGLSTINLDYLPAIQKFYKLKQCCGIIGGRPSKALYFIGMADEEMIYLDPHICQPVVDIIGEQIENVERPEDNSRIDQESGDMEVNMQEPRAHTSLIDDSSFHCDCVAHMDFDQMDPSLAVGFVIKDKEDYMELKEALEKLHAISKPQLFEMIQSRPKGFPKFELYRGVPTSFSEADYSDVQEGDFHSDVEFEELHEIDSSSESESKSTNNTEQ
uniref:Cysteine protease n=1 Tax=Rhabditophanes sp. KR3021 TaxID=114890 RepID=A0AC35UC24_9BILA